MIDLWRIAGTGYLVAIVMQSQTPQLQVRLDTEEAEAVLALVELGPRATPQDWQHLFQSAGYRRLQEREAAIQVPFTDSAFRAFVLSPTLSRQRGDLRRTLESWRAIRVDGAARRAFQYLPSNARIRASIYPVIKPRRNTFVWEPRTNPAIFFYLNPAMSAAQFENTLAHELHHLGVASACNNDSLPLVQQWMSGFSEGRAMLAAATDPDVHPHAVSNTSDRATWDRDFANVARDIQRLEAFFADLITGALTQEQRNERGFAFVNSTGVPQGPYYTVGYHMARAIEKRFGRNRLVESTCDPRMFLSDYNHAATAQGLPRWSDAFLQKLSSK